LKILITGINGLLGRSLANILVKDEHSVYGISHVEIKNKIKHVEYLNIDLSKNWSTNELPKEIDVIVHLAQSSKFRSFPENALDVFNVNIHSTAKLLDFASKNSISKFIFTSSGGVYKKRNEPFLETESLLMPKELGYYLGSKASGEILAQSYISEFNVVILRPFFIYGPNQNRTMLIPRIFDNISNNQPIILDGKEGLSLNPIHVSDAAKATQMAIHLNNSSIFNLGGPNILTLKKIATEMGVFLKKDPIFEITDKDPDFLIADIGEMSAKLHNPKISLLSSFEDIAANTIS
jgi:UDP-glucose 4-epimerase